MEIEFEPIMDTGSDVPDKFLQGGPPGGSGNGRAMSANNKAEDALDKVLQGMLGQPFGDMPRQRGQARDAAAAPQETHWTSPDGSQDITIQEFPMQRSSMPVDVFHGLFPGPFMIEDEDSNSASFSDPDPLIMEMLQEFHDDSLLPVLNKVPRASRAPKSCQQDVLKHCGKQRSQVHCLGHHQADISDQCRADVGKSVPYLCSTAIDRFCDVLQRGILQCLGDHFKDLDTACADAVNATRRVIARANTQKTSVKLTDPTTGKKTVFAKPGSPLPLLLSQQAKAPDRNAGTREAQADAILQGAASNKGSAGTETHESTSSPNLLGATPVESSLHSSFTGKVLVLAVIMMACIFAFSDYSKTVNNVLKKYVAKEEASRPLMSTVELPKSV